VTPPLVLLAALAIIYNAADWRHYPAMNVVRQIAVTPARLYVAVPRGVYVFSRGGAEHLTTLTVADGISGDVTTCAFNPARDELLVATEDGLYAFIEEPRITRPLDPPFGRALSIGIAAGEAWFDTDKGPFRRGRPGDDFVPVTEFPAEVDWHGRRDTLTARDFPQLAPFFVTDDQLITHELHHTRRDPRARRLYVAARDYGVLVYNLTSGLPERHLRVGPPPGQVRQIARLDPAGSLWFAARDANLVVTPDGEWRYARSLVTDLVLPPGLRGFAGLRELFARASVNAVVSDGNRLFAATSDGLYLVTGDGGLTRLTYGGHEPLALAWAGRDTLLVGTDAELLMLTGDTTVVVADPFERSGFGIYSISVSDDGTRWFGAFGGILRSSPEGEWEHLIPPGFDLGRPVRTLATADSILFFPSPDGLTALDLRSGFWETIGIREGLPIGEVTALHADSRFLWVAGPGMISRFDYRRGLPR
jgi:ligand-binding sensor domain-containing protein